MIEKPTLGRFLFSFLRTSSKVCSLIFLISLVFTCSQMFIIIHQPSGTHLKTRIHGLFPQTYDLKNTPIGFPSNPFDQFLFLKNHSHINVTYAAFNKGNFNLGGGDQWQFVIPGDHDCAMTDFKAAWAADVELFEQYQGILVAGGMENYKKHGEPKVIVNGVIAVGVTLHFMVNWTGL